MNHTSSAASFKQVASGASLKMAVILAGGLGTRLRSVVSELPKPMAPINNRPFLAYQLDYCVTQGIETIILSVGYKYECIKSYFGDTYRGMALHYVIESSPLGTGGGLCLALAKIDQQHPFLLCNGDTYFPVPIHQLETIGNAQNAAVVFSLFKTNDTQRYMGIGCATDGLITTFHASMEDKQHTVLANGGVYWINPQQLLPAMTAFRNAKHAISLEKDVFPSLLKAGVRMVGKEITQVFIDIGVPEDYYRAADIIDT